MQRHLNFATWRSSGFVSKRCPWDELASSPCEGKMGPSVTGSTWEIALSSFSEMEGKHSFRFFDGKGNRY